MLRPLAEPLLLRLSPEDPGFVEARRLLSFLQWFEPATADTVPDNSILREFVGGSILEGFSLWPTAPGTAHSNTAAPEAAPRHPDAAKGGLG